MYRRVKSPNVGQCLFLGHTDNTVYDKQANFNAFLNLNNPTLSIKETTQIDN